MPRITRILDRYLGGTNLEVFKFGLYILFPISWMYYFGTNLDNRFSVPDFWPKPGETHKIPFEREDVGRELGRLRERRLRLRGERLEREREGRMAEGLDGQMSLGADGRARQADEAVERGDGDGDGDAGE